VSTAELAALIEDLFAMFEQGKRHGEGAIAKAKESRSSTMSLCGTQYKRSVRDLRLSGTI